MQLRGGHKIAEGSRSGDGSITLAAQNSSGVTGTVNVTYTADIAAGVAFLDIRWAKKYEIHVDTVLTKTLKDQGLANHQAAVVGPLATGNRDIQVRAISDTGVSGTLSGAITKSIPGRPNPPGAISYTSGTRANTVVSFEASTTSGATYRLYDSAYDEPIDFTTVAATRAAGSGTLTLTLPDMGSNSAAKRRICIVALDGGIEDGLRRRLVLEYDSTGAFVPQRPNIPGFSFKSVTSGRKLTVDYSYNKREQKGTAQDINLYVFKEGDAISYASADATAVLGTDPIEVGTLNFTPASDGWYFYIVRTATSGGDLSENTQLMGPVYLSNTTLAAPANVAVEVLG